MSQRDENNETRYHITPRSSGLVTDDEERKKKTDNEIVWKKSLVMHFYSVTGGTEIVYTLFVNDME